MKMVSKAMLLFVILGNCQFAAAAVLYQEAFTNEGSGNHPNDLGWRIHTPDFGGAHEVTASTSGSVNLSSAGGDNPAGTEAGNPIAFGNSVNASPIVAEPGNGFAFLGRSGNFLFWTEEYTIAGVDLSVGNDLTVSYSHRMNNPEDIRVALRIGTDWFVTDASTVTSSGTNFAASGDRETVNLFTSSWNDLNFAVGTFAEGGVAPSVGSAVAGLPTGDITAFGLFADNSSTTSTRIDTYTIQGTQIPEPATIGLLGLGGLALLGRRRFA